MKKTVLAVCLALVSATGVLAEEAKPAGLKPDDVKNALGVSFYLQGGYTYNGNASSPVAGQGEENDLRVFDHKANSFTLDLAQVVFFKDAAVDTAGYKIKLSAGETAKWIHSLGLSGAPLTASQTGDGTDSFDVTEAYMSYIVGVGKGLRFDLGKMVTYMGAEVIEAKDNANYSRGLLFNYAIPFTHTGLKASYTFSDMFNAALFAVKGWDNTTDNNGGKSYGVSLGITPAEVFSASINVMQGPEKDNNNYDTRTITDLIATIKPTKKLSLVLNYDNGKEENGALPSVKWSGLAGIVKYDLTDKYSVALRGESFDDKDGVRTGTAQKLKEVTATFETRLNGGLILRPEYRHDISDKQSFDNGKKKTQDTIALGVMYAW